MPYTLWYVSNIDCFYESRKSKTPDKKKRSVSPEAKKLTHREGEITVKDEPLDKVRIFPITF